MAGIKNEEDWRVEKRRKERKRKEAMKWEEHNGNLCVYPPATTRAQLSCVCM